LPKTGGWLRGSWAAFDHEEPEQKGKKKEKGVPGDPKNRGTGQNDNNKMEDTPRATTEK